MEELDSEATLKEVEDVEQAMEKFVMVGGPSNE